MALTQSQTRFDRTGKRFVESGVITWTSTDASGTLTTGLKIIRGASFVTCKTSTAVADVTSIAQAPDAKGNIIVPSTGLPLSRTTATSGLTQLYRLEGE